MQRFVHLPFLTLFNYSLCLANNLASRTSAVLVGLNNHINTLEWSATLNTSEVDILHTGHLLSGVYVLDSGGSVINLELVHAEVGGSIHSVGPNIGRIQGEINLLHLAQTCEVE